MNNNIEEASSGAEKFFDELFERELGITTLNTGDKS